MGGGLLPKVLMGGLGLYLIISVVLGMFWSSEPETFDVAPAAAVRASAEGHKVVVGSTTTATLIILAETILDKPGGYIHNDIFPPGIWLDNMSSWEFGVLVQVRDLARALRKDLSRVQSQSTEDPDLAIAEPQFNFDSRSWAIPSTEREYRRGIAALNRYLGRLSDDNKQDAQFYARADNLRNWLSDIENRLGSLSQRLSESVGRNQLDMGLAGDPSAQQSTATTKLIVKKTPWLEIDNIFYEARGTTWALIHILKAIEVDFDKVLRDKNALVSLKQIIIELEATQETVWSPMILNGSGFGMTANHSITMTSYISRANAAIIELRNLLQQG
ncbi:DUF2333 family protein [Alkalimarinus alittae]|uniref:DUF2333 family protein n=1 Tax=Alkalimarinus alittae TaxID=2961619 RepID=A0ABY6N7B0_9ALTE|nr:DUF2333 family protein [Alkalimarinus alittae]UZE97992.1 DUF2333 family protein [Alkalimarinus alittae]